MKILKSFFTIFFIVAMTVLFCGLADSLLSSNYEKVMTGNYVVAIALIALALLVILFFMFLIARNILKHSGRVPTLNLIAFLLMLIITSFLFSFAVSIHLNLNWIKNMYPYPIYSEIFDLMKDKRLLEISQYSFVFSVAMVFASILHARKLKKSEPELVLD
jgi:hypothetical protein